MITGDVKLSPNNVSDLRAATQIANKTGNKVKVILITQAGSEGLDFKFIRQVHILEPWYNLSRIEQIIGRAVRNCSHKDLPLIERNVQIFLHGSELVENSEEAADLYVYRLAEDKAIKIGEVTRILKEISVDCLLNSEQLNFSAENLQLKIKQKLSNGKTIDFAVGDKPFSAQCDYMKTCMYKCKPVNEIGDINNLSYSESFIEMNSERIINRIRQLMKEKYFYKKADLITEINIIRKYPLVQINAALNHLVTDKNEYLVDKYNRLGTMINIGDYYFFQPLELNADNISIYERSVPIPYKHDRIPISISEQINKKEATAQTIAPVIEDIQETVASAKESTTSDLEKTIKKSKQIKGPIIVPVENIPITHKGKTLLAKMLVDYNTSTTKQIIVRGEKDVWYKYSSIVLK